jgi:hypothetical protein
MSEEDKITNIKDQPILVCPHCAEFIIIEKMNCGIFRHGVLKKCNKQIEPHATKPICDYYTQHNLIYGCGKPFRIVIQDNIFVIEICDYI